MKRKNVFKIYFLAAIFGFSACGEWLDVIPDGVASLDMAFNSRAQAIKYLSTCYSYLPRNCGSSDPVMLGGDDIFTYPTQHLINRFNIAGLDIARGMQSATSPILGRWDGMYQALRVCNTFIENVDKVPDLLAWEREQWKAEIIVLKAYYHYILLQMYGPIPIIRESLPIDVDFEQLKVSRDPVDECVDYIIELLDEACESEHLPAIILDPASDLGRITKPIALSIKAKVLVMAASPLFNGNNDQSTLRNRDGTQLYNQTYDVNKWEKAVVACREAIAACHDADMMLYRFQNVNNRYTDTIATDITLRNAFNLQWNSEIVWGNTQMISIPTNGGNIYLTIPKLNNAYVNSNDICQWFGMPIKIARMYYTNHGVPLEEDNTRDVRDLYNLRTAQAKDNLYIREGRTTVDLHFDREPRFYAWVGFDGAVWFGAGQYNDRNPSSLWYLAFKMGETDGSQGQGNWTGYLPKKFIPFEAQFIAVNTISSLSYAWPIIRLSDLYLLYAEAINEVEGPNGPNSAEMFKYIDEVRNRAGLLGVKESWNTYANNRKYENQNGMRQIIQQERLIELSMEGIRYWDIRRWKIAPEIYRTPQEGWNMMVSTIDGTEEEVNRIMYTPQLLQIQSFGIRDYFWPIRKSDIDVNPNLVQNIGW